jgi:LacI family transcriptional regulator
MISLKQVAALAGVSASTVSRAISSPERVNALTRQRIEEALAALDYVPNGTARALRTRRTRSIGALVPAFNNELYSLGVESLQQVLEAAGYTLLLTCHRYDLALELRSTRSLLERGIDGLVMVGLQHDPELFSLIRRRELPYVLTWAWDETLQHPTVGYSNAKAAAKLVEHLLALGHRELAVITGPLARSDRLRDRLRGIQRTLSNRALGVRETHIIEAEYAIASAQHAMRRVLALEPRPTAVMCSNDLLAVAALAACQEAGVAVPDQISIVGFGDMDVARLHVPRLTTIRSPIAEIGAAAGRQLLARLAGFDPPLQQEFDADIIVGQSSAPPPAGGLVPASPMVRRQGTPPGRLG